MSALDELFREYSPTLTTREAAEILCTTQVALAKNLRDGEVPGYLVHGRWVLLRDELRDYLMQSRNGATR